MSFRFPVLIAATLLIAVAVCILGSAETESLARLRAPVFSNATDTTEIDTVLNEEGRRFVYWTRVNGLCYVTPDANGVIRSIIFDICWHPSDEQIKTTTSLKGLNRLAFMGQNTSDVTLRHISQNPTIRNVRVIAENRFSAEALESIRQARPDLSIDLPRKVKVKQKPGMPSAVLLHVPLRDDSP